MKRTPTTQAYAKPVAARYSLGQATAKEIADHLYGAKRAIDEALAKASKLSNRTDFAALTGDLERLHADISEARETADWLRRGKPTTSKGERRHG